MAQRSQYAMCIIREEFRSLTYFTMHILSHPFITEGGLLRRRSTYVQFVSNGTFLLTFWLKGHVVFKLL